jgi:hypothetical protein
MATREIVVFYGPIPLDPTKKYDSAIMEAAFPQNGLLAAWEELKASGLIGKFRKYDLTVKPMPDKKMMKGKMEIMDHAGKILLPKSDLPVHEKVGEYLVVVCRHFGVEPNEPNLNKKINEQLVKFAHDIRTSKIKKDAGKQKMEPLLAEGGLVNPIDERDDLVKILMDSNYAENWHDVIELCLQHVTDLSDTRYLHFAVAKKGSIRLINSLISKGCDINQADYEGWTPLHWAAYVKVKRLAEVLLAAGANINAQSKDGNTPAHLAKNSPLKGDDVHTFLKKSGADSTLKNNLGQTA